MNSKVDAKTDAPATVVDYATVVENISGGQFTSRFSEDGRRFFASLYGAPFFALARLAPELSDNPSTSILIADSIGSFAADGGRWLSLYARAQKLAFRITCTICVTSRPRQIKAPKPLLFQPPQQVLVKKWSKHLSDLDVPPDITIVYVPDGFEEIKAMAEEVCRLSKGRKVLLACDSRTEVLFVQSLLQSRGCQTSDVLGFDQSKNEPQHFASGAWWISAVPPTDEAATSLDGSETERLRIAYRCFRGFIRRAKDRMAVSRVAALYGARTVETVAGESIKAVRVSPTGGIDLTTGRFFSIKEDVEEEEFSWEDKALSADLLALAPKENAGLQPGEHLDLLIWLGNAITEGTRRELSDASGDTKDTETDTEELQSVTPIVEQEVLPAANIAVVAEPSVPAKPTDAAPAFEAESSRPRRSRLSRSAGTVNVLALAALLGKAGKNSDTAFNTAKARILAWLGAKGFNIPEASGNSHVELSDGEVSIETDGQSIWSLRFDDRRSMELGAIWRVEATLLGQPQPAISMRLIQVRSTEEAPPPVASGVPQVVAAIAKQVGLADAGVALLSSAVHLSGDLKAPWLTQLLLNPNRTQPVIVVSGSADPSVERLAGRLVGVAHVVCIDNAISSQLIRTFGRDRSVYGNAVRLYRPGFIAEADPYQHPVWTLKGPLLLKWVANDIFEEACAISLEVGDLDDRAPSFQSVRNHLAEQRLASTEQRLAALRQQAENIASSKDEQIGQLQALHHGLESALAEYKVKASELDQLVLQLRAELQATHRERDDAREEARQLRYQLDNRWTDAEAHYDQSDDSIEYPDNWDDLETWVELYGENKLVLHPLAAKAARESPFKDIPFAYKALDYLVRFYVPMRTRDKDDHSAYHANQQALAELGLELSGVGTALDDKRYKQEYRRQYEGRDIWLDQHLKWGAGFDPTTLFRLYFHYDEAAAKVIVGHMPTHLTNRITHSG